MPRALTVGALALGLLAPARARAQACCAGASAMTPGRLELHETALVGVQLRAAGILGSYDSSTNFRANPDGAAQLDLEQALFGSWRWLSRGQVSLSVPWLQSWRTSSTTGGEFGGGLGDVNVSARYDVVRNRELRFFPGVGVLVGVTLPTGRAPEQARQPLASDATGVGTTQLALGLALERSFGRVLLNLTGLAAQRFDREVYGLSSALATRFDVLLGASYSLSEDVAAAVVADYGWEGNASLNGDEVPSTAARRFRLSLALSGSLSDSFRLQGALQLDPPLDGVGQNRTATLGGSLTLLWTFR